MAHGLEADDYMFAVGGGQWHNIGARIERAPTIEDGIRLAKLDWTVSMRGVYTSSGDGGSLVEMPDYRAIVRDTDDKAYGIAGKKYTPLQNIEAFRWFDPVLETGEISLETAGSIHSGRRVWVLAKWNKEIEVVRGDSIKPYVMLTNTHDGTRSVQAKTTSVRVVCKNTLNGALRDGGGGINIRHTSSMQDRLQVAQDMLKNISVSFERQKEEFQSFASVRCEGKTLDDYLYAIVPDNEESENNARTKNIRDGMKRHAISGDGTDIPGVRGSLWAAFNGVTQFASHDRLKGKDADDRAESLWFGSSADLISKAQAKARELVPVLAQ